MSTSGAREVVEKPEKLDEDGPGDGFGEHVHAPRCTCLRMLCVCGGYVSVVLSVDPFASMGGLWAAWALLTVTPGPVETEARDGAS